MRHRASCASSRAPPCWAWASSSEAPEQQQSRQDLGQLKTTAEDDAGSLCGSGYSCHAHLRSANSPLPTEVATTDGEEEPDGEPCCFSLFMAYSLIVIISLGVKA